MTTAPSQPIDLADVYRRLRPILEPYRERMVVVQDNERGFYLNTRSVMKNGQPLFFASLAVNKRYVSFHVFPVYMYPELLEGIGDLKRRMQGKSCFNFSRLTDDQVERMAALIKAGYEKLKAEGDI
jgi:hypothetical protein